MASKQDAKDAVVGIAKGYGFIDEDVMGQIEQWNPSIRRMIEESMLAKDKLAAHSIKTLAKNIYGSDARFVFELLQNADDNRFTKAKANGSLPFISFDIHPNRIVVECNEDGFTKSDLTAICSVGESTKSASHGYIGAKGIGFKSVFIAAWKVAIQSGHFSFYFKHEKGDLGLGMVLPIWEDAEEELESPLTRMTLHLHEKGDANELEHLRHTIFKQLADLQETCLLFLRNLKHIRIAFYDEDSNIKSCKDFRIRQLDEHSVCIGTEQIGDGDEEATTEKMIYHVTKHTATGLSKSDNRELPDTDEARRTSSRAEVVIAFPLTADLEPVIAKQDIFAFLPVRESNFYFLIQSDFDTSANRQDIVTTSRRNVGLLDGIAAAFIKAVLQFCKHPKLCYTWPRFLPPPNDDSGGFWSGLNQRIKRLIPQTPILRSRHGMHLRTVDDVVIVSGDFKDDAGEPLLDDPVLDFFILALYPFDCQSALQSYGLKILNRERVLRLLRADLSRSTSKLKSTTTDQKWHSALANVLVRVCRDSTRVLYDVALIPLRTGEWVAASSGSVYLPTTNGIPIPSGLNPRILDPTAVSNPDRMTLFKLLGAGELPISEVRSSILRIYDSNVRVTLATSVAHLHYLYLTHEPRKYPSSLTSIYVYHSNGDSENPHKFDFYLQSNDPYGPKALLGPVGGEPGLEVNFLHPKYFDDVPSLPNPTCPSWKGWLHKFVGIRERIRLVSSDLKHLSDAWYYVARHRPKKALGLLKRLWPYESDSFKKNQGFVECISYISADSICISKPSMDLYLSDSYLPLPHLQAQCLHYLVEPECFPFLELEGFFSPEELITEWKFLITNFGVGKDDNVKFLIGILTIIKYAHHQHSIKKPERILDLYHAIYAKCIEGVNDETEMMHVREEFDAFGFVFIPGKEGKNEVWARLSECLWEAPPDMTVKHSLKHLYKFALDTGKTILLPHFFQQILSIPDASYSDLILELEHLRKNGCEDFDRILSLYRYLVNMGIDAVTDEVRQEFAIKKLIFVVNQGKPGWYTSSECLWSSTTEIQGKVTLNGHYEDLQNFFIDIVNVQTLTLSMVYDEMLQTRGQRTVEDIKDLIWSFNALLQTELDPVDPKPLLKASIFPVDYPNGTVTPRSADIEFAIGDRNYLIEHFKGKIKLLDYDLEEVQQLKPFFQWAGLTHRYLSAVVKETTFISDGIRYPISVPHRSLRHKAHALLRIAATFNSPRYKADAKGLYLLLRTANIMETNGISSILRVLQDNQSAEVEVAVGDMHINETSSKLTIYVPVDKKKQDFCFASPLPVNLADWLMRDPVTQIRDILDDKLVITLTTFLTFDPLVMDPILDYQGIMQVPIANEDVEAIADDVRTLDPLGDEVRSSRQSMTPDTSTSGPLVGSAETPYASNSSAYQGSPDSIVEYVVARQSHMARHSSAASYSLPQPILSLQPDSVYDSTPYRLLLEKVVQAARNAAFPSSGTFGMAGLINALPEDHSFASFDGFDGRHVRTKFRSDNQLERDRKIGAAGELYVFELLSGLDPSLQKWGRGNWQSTIRRYVRVHPDYADLEPWYGRETADINYDDTEGDLTTMLIDQGYLDHNEWQDARPSYYIEVKTTTGPCNTPFYMSKHQYQRMQNAHNQNQRSKVYMVLRVFNIDSDSDEIGMRVYLDPEQLRLNGGLEFTGETWSVVPR